jgi:hypothetical protein
MSGYDGKRWDVLTVKDRGENQKPWFTKIGAAFESAKGTGTISVVLDALPIDGKLILKIPDVNEQGGGGRGEPRRSQPVPQGQRGGGQQYGRSQGRQQGAGQQQRYRDSAPQAPRAEDADFTSHDDTDPNDLPF